MRLLAPAEPSSTFDPPAFDLASRPTRPGGVHVELRADVSLGLAAKVRTTAASEGLPAEAWSAIVIESERVLGTLPVGRARLVAELDLAARDQAAVMPGGARRLADYAAALRAGAALPIDRTPMIESAAGRLRRLPPTTRQARGGSRRSTAAKPWTAGSLRCSPGRPPVGLFGRPRRQSAARPWLSGYLLRPPGGARRLDRGRAPTLPGAPRIACGARPRSRTPGRPPRERVA